MLLMQFKVNKKNGSLNQLLMPKNFCKKNKITNEEITNEEKIKKIKKIVQEIIEKWMVLVGLTGEGSCMMKNENVEEQDKKLEEVYGMIDENYKDHINHQINYEIDNENQLEEQESQPSYQSQGDFRIWFSYHIQSKSSFYYQSESVVNKVNDKDNLSEPSLQNNQSKVEVNNQNDALDKQQKPWLQNTSEGVVNNQYTTIQNNGIGQDSNHLSKNYDQNCKFYTNQQRTDYHSIKELILNNIGGKKMRNKKLMKSDMAIKALIYLKDILQKEYNVEQLRDCITQIQKVHDEVQEYEDQIPNNEFDKFTKRKFYKDKECDQIYSDKKCDQSQSDKKFNQEIFNTNIFNIIASQLILNNKEKCIKKLQERHKQLSKSWINLLDFQKSEHKKYLELINDLDLQGIKLSNKHPCKNYKKYDFLEIALELLTNLRDNYDNSSIKQKILELLNGIVKMKYNKYTQKKQINFTKHDITDLLYFNNEFDMEAMKELEGIVDKPLIQTSGLKKKVKQDQ